MNKVYFPLSLPFLQSFLSSSSELNVIENGELTFVDIIVAIRRSIGIKQHFSKSANNDDFVKFTAQEISHLISQLSLAA